MRRSRQRFDIAAVDLRQSELSDAPGAAVREVPAAFAANDGVSRLGMAASAVGDAPVVRVEALDGVLNGAAVTVLKMDVEGHERAVLRGASRALGERQIRHVIFEDHQPQPSDVVRDLQSAGYQVLSLGWSIRGPIVRLVETAGLAKEFEAPNFIAATHSEDLIARCSPPGWRVRRRRFSSRRIRR